VVLAARGAREGERDTETIGDPALARRLREQARGILVNATWGATLLTAVLVVLDLVL
jgi:hypothetical protein